MFRIILCICLLSFLGCKENNNSSIDLSEMTGDTDVDFVTKEISKNTGNPDLYFERAKLFYDRKNYDGSIEDIQSAMRIDSLNPKYYHLLADVYMDYYQSRRALFTMKELVKIYPERSESLLKLAEIQFILKKYLESINSINKAIKVDRENANAYLLLGMNFREQGNFKQALNSFQTAVEMDPELIDGWLILGDLYANNESKLAETYYDNALRVNPESIEALHTKAFYLQNEERIDEAIELYNKIKGIKRDYSDAYLNTGILYLEMDSVDRAFEEFEIITQVDPASHLGYFYRGIANEMKGNIEAAKLDFQSCLNLNSQFKKAEIALRKLDQ